MQQAPRIIYNSDAGNALGDFFGRAAALDPVDPAAIRAIIRSSIAELAVVGVDTLAVVVSHRFESLFGPSRVLEEHWRLDDRDGGYAAARAAGMDLRILLAAACHRHGLAFWGCIRMNDRHPGHVGAFIRAHPQWHLNELQVGPAIDFAPEPVRQTLLDYIAELIAGVAVDGIVLDYMRHCHLFHPGQGAANAPLLTDFMEKTRALLDTAASRRGGARLALAVRVPQTLEESDYLGFDLATWIRQGWVDAVIPSDFFFTDLNTPVEAFVRLAEGTACRVYPAIHPLICDGNDMRLNDQAAYRAAAQTFYAAGAAGLEAYNYHYHWAQRNAPKYPGSGRYWPAALAHLDRLRDPVAVARHDRHYRFFQLWNREPPSGKSAWDERIRLTRPSPRSSAGPALARRTGSQRFRLAEDPGDTRLRAVLQFKAVGLAEDEGLEIALNDTPVAPHAITHRFFAEGQDTAQGRPLPAHALYTIDLDMGTDQVPLRYGENRLTVGLLAGPAAGDGAVVIEELEVYVYVRPRERIV